MPEPDPPQSYLTAVSARLINEMGRSAAAHTLVPHIPGSNSNQVFNAWDKNIKLVSALQEDFGYFMREAVLHFDAYPGPYCVLRNIAQIEFRNAPNWLSNLVFETYGDILGATRYARLNLIVQRKTIT